MTEPLDLPNLEDQRAQRSVRGQIILALRAALVSGQMQPGEVYSAPALAGQFGVSPTPVREAMLELVKEGLVTTVRNKGFRVRELSDEELDEITEIRLLLEVPATVKVIGLAAPADLARLRPMAKSLVETAKRKDLVGYVAQDQQFHLALLALAGNQHLVALVGELRARSRLFGLHGLAERGELTASAREHEAMLRLIQAADSAGLERLMRTHIGHVRGSWAGRSET
jgi:DNA-binding GntR family transcriptional regulator